MTDYYEISESIAKTIAKAATPLTEDQKIAMSGALAVYLNKAENTMPDCVKELISVFKKYDTLGTGYEDLNLAVCSVRDYYDNAKPNMPECVREMLKHFEDVMHGFERKGVVFKDGVSGIPTIKAVRDYYGEKE